MDKKKKIIILVLVVAFVLYYFTKNKETKQEEVSAPELSVEEKVSVSLKSASNKVNTLVQENIQETTMTPEQEEYNLARQKYFNLYGAYPQSSWSLVQINTAIKDKKEVDALISEYISKGGDQSKIDGDEDIVTINEMKTYLSLLNNEYEIALDKAESELGFSIDRDKYNSVAKLEQFKISELSRMKKAWEETVSSLSGRASEFQTHLNSHAKVAFFNKIKDDCNWYCSLPDNQRVAVGEVVGWNLLLAGKLGWMKDDTRYTWEQRNAFAAANLKAITDSKRKVDAYGRII